MNVEPEFFSPSHRKIPVVIDRVKVKCQRIKYRDVEGNEGKRLEKGVRDKKNRWTNKNVKFLSLDVVRMKILSQQNLLFRWLYKKLNSRERQSQWWRFFVTFDVWLRGKGEFVTDCQRFNILNQFWNKTFD